MPGEDEVQNLLDQLDTMTPAQLEAMTNDLASFVESWARWRYLPRAKNFVRDRILSNGNPVTTDATGATRDLKNTSVFDTLNIIGGSVNVNASNARQADISLGSGADCMFDYLVSSCFATLHGFTEGQTFTSLSGCTFKGFSTVTGAANDITALASPNSNYVVYVCSGTYGENPSFPQPNSGGSLHLVGAGDSSTQIVGTVSGGTTLSISTTGGFKTVRGMTITAHDSASAVGLSMGASLCALLDVTLVATNVSSTAASLAVGHNGFNIVNCNIGGTVGTSNGVGIQIGGGAGSVRCTSSLITAGVGVSLTTEGADVFFGECLFSGATGIKLSGSFQGLRVGASNSEFTCATAGVICTSASSLIESAFIGNRFVNCPDAIKFGTTDNNAQFNQIIGNLFIGSGTNKAITDNGANQYSTVIGNSFFGYTSGNELIGFDTTDNTIGHNETDSGATLTDTHLSSGTAGTAAPSSEAFVTIGNSANLSAERALTAGNGVGFTDGGANSTATLKLVPLTALYDQSGAFNWVNRGGDLLIANSKSLSVYSDNSATPSTQTAQILGSTGHASFGAGAAFPPSALVIGNFNDSFTDPAGTVTGLLGSLTSTLTADNTQLLRAMSFTFTVSGAHNQTGIVRGANPSFVNSGATTSDVRMLSPIANVSSGTVTALYHIYLPNAIGAGTLATQYGVYLENMTKGGTNWAIYSLGGQSSHLGSFSIGSNSAPSASAILDLTNAANLGLLLPNVANASQPTGTAGLVYYDTTKKAIYAYEDNQSGSSNVYQALHGIRDINFFISGGGAAVALNTVVDLIISFACTVVDWSVLVVDNAADSATIDLLSVGNASSAGALTYTSMVGAGTKPNVSAAVASGQTAPASWTTTAIAANTILQAKVTSAPSTATGLLLNLKVRTT